MLDGRSTGATYLVCRVCPVYQCRPWLCELLSSYSETRYHSDHRNLAILPFLMRWLLCVGLLSHLVLNSAAFSFDWPEISGQCETGRLNWTGGVPPYKIILVYVMQSFSEETHQLFTLSRPLNDYVFTYDVPDTAYNAQTQQWTYDVSTQHFVGNFLAQ